MKLLMTYCQKLNLEIDNDGNATFNNSIGLGFVKSDIICYEATRIIAPN